MTQLYAKIKNSSRHAAQQSYHLDTKGVHIPFPVTIDENEDESVAGAVKGGIGGNYMFKDVNLYVKYNGKFKRI